MIVSLLIKFLWFIFPKQTGTGKTLAFLLPAFIHIDGQDVYVHTSYMYMYNYTCREIMVFGDTI